MVAHASPTFDPDCASARLFRRALRVMPGGNSRHTIFFPPFPPYAERGHGCRVVDADGVERLDFVNNYSALIHGHSRPEIIAALTQQAQRLLAVGLPTQSEVELAELLCERVPSIAQVRFTNSGTEAVMFAVKAARAFTGRTKIAKMEGAYHGSYDPVETSLAAAPSNWGPADAPLSVPLCRGTPAGVIRDVIVLPQNDLEATRSILQTRGSELAAVIVDPLPSRLAYAEAQPAYLRMLRELTRASGSLLIFDEVYSLRLGYGGVQGNLGIEPDLTALGKIIGGGFPVGAVGGAASCMSVFTTEKGKLPAVVHGGTYNANPMTMVAGLESMRLLTPESIAHLDRLGELLRSRMRDVLCRVGVPAIVRGQGSLTAVRLTARDGADYRALSLDGHDEDLAHRLHRELLNRGVLCTSGLHFILSTAMTQEDIEQALDAFDAALRAAIAN